MIYILQIIDIKTFTDFLTQWVHFNFKGSHLYGKLSLPYFHIFQSKKEMELKYYFKVFGWSSVHCLYYVLYLSKSSSNPDRAPLKEVLGGQYNYREGGRQVLRQGAKGRRRNRKWQCSKDPSAQKVSGGRTDPSPKYRWKVHG